MNGIHDMGGLHGFGAVVTDSDEQVFHAEWERRVFGLWAACFAGGHYSGDRYRHAAERTAPLQYLQGPYYANMLRGAERSLIEGGKITSGELAARMAEPREGVRSPETPLVALTLAQVPGLLASGGSTRSAVSVTPGFSAGDHVVARNIHSCGHTRLPRYVRGKSGIVVVDHGVFEFNDAESLGISPKPQHVYSVRFTMRELWGSAASSKDVLYIDMFEDYLQPSAS